jgi:hypothetical protein
MRASFISLSLFAISAFALTFAPALLQPSIKADIQKAGVLTPASTGAISGIVIDDFNSDPLEGVEVKIYDSNGNVVTSGFANSSGVYTTPAVLATGTYFALSNSSDYVNEVYNNRTCAVNCDPVSIGTPIAVTSGSTTTGIDFELDEAAVITGKVTDASTSLPLANVEVQILFTFSPTPTLRVFTDSEGDFSTSNLLRAGTYIARTANSSGYVDELYKEIPCAPCDLATGTLIVTTAGSTTSNINFTLSPGGRISGNVSDEDSASPIDGVTLTVFSSGGGLITTTRTDETGNYIFGAGLPTGSYFVRATNSQGFINELYDDIVCLSCPVTGGTPINVTAPLATSGINFTLRRGGLISGNIRNAVTLTPVGSVNVRIYSAGGTFLAGPLADNAGNYMSSGLPTGTYFAHTSGATFQGLFDSLFDNISCTTCSTPTLGTPISVTIGQTTSINFGLCASFSLSPSGRVFSATGGEGTFNITSPGGCGWIVSSNVPWIEIISDRVSNGNGTVGYLVRGNPNATQRVGQIGFVGGAFRILQEGQAAPTNCTFSISPQSATYSAAGGPLNISVTTQQGCGWQSQSDSSWITTSDCCGISSGFTSYTVQPNQTGAARTGKITIAGKKISIKQMAN